MTPSFVPRQAGTDIPDWNSAGFLGQWRELMAELGRRYGDDPRLGYVDVGGYGSYGEWHVGEGERVSDANGLAIVDAVASAFPTKHVLINTMTSVEFTLKALGRARQPRHPHRQPRLPRHVLDGGRRRAAPVGLADPAVLLRVVHAGRPRPGRAAGPPVPRLDAVVGQHAVEPRRLTAPQRSAYATALATAGYRIRLRSLTLPRSITAGRRIVVRTSWANQGSAPTYDRWDVRLTFERAGRTVSASLGQQLEGLVASSRRTTKVSVPRLSPGRYDVLVSVVDPTGYSQPMHLANAGRTASGAYRVGSVRVR